MKNLGFTIDELIEELQLIREETGNVEVVIPQIGDEKEIGDGSLEWDAHITYVLPEVDDDGVMVVRVF